MAKVFAVSAALAMLAGCGVSELYPSIVTVGGGAGSGVGGHSGSSGGRTSGNENSVGGNSATVGGVGSVGGNTNGPGGTSSTGRNNGTVGGKTVGGNTGSVGGNGTTGRISNGSGPGTGGRTSGGKTSGGNTTGGTGCIALYSKCDASVGCGCGNACVFDQVLEADVCEATCTKTGCSDPKTTCDGKNCVLIPCGPGSGNGSYDGPCSAGNPNGTEDGTCVPIGTDAGSAFCTLAGTSDGGCDPDATRSQPANICIQGEYCEHDPHGVGYTCWTLCDPGNGGTQVCQADGFTFCVPLQGLEGSLGVCF